MEFGIEKCAKLIMMIGKRESANKDVIRTLGERENHKYLEILEEDVIKIRRWRKKQGNNTSDERESFLKPSPATEISSKE